MKNISLFMALMLCSNFVFCMQKDEHNGNLNDVIYLEAGLNNKLEEALQELLYLKKVRGHKDNKTEVYEEYLVEVLRLLNLGANPNLYVKEEGLTGPTGKSYYLINIIAMCPGSLIHLHHLITEHGQKLNIEAKDSEGNTPLLNAAASNQVDNVRYLIENGADINAINNQSSCAFVIFCNKENADGIRLLFEHTEKLDLSNTNVLSLPITARFSPNKEIASMIRDYLKSINKK